MTSDPSTWQSASETPDMAKELDSLEDMLREVASEELAKLKPEARGLIIPVIARVAKEGIRRATSNGLIHDDESATYTPKFREAMARILAETHDADNPRLYIDCIDFVLQLGIRQGMSQTDIADDYHVTRACVSKICVGITERYGMIPGRGMKSEQSRVTFAKRQIGKRAKPAPEPWKGGSRLKAAFASVPHS